MNLEKIGPSTHCRGFSGHSMSDSAQVTSRGAINSMIAAMSTRPARQNRRNMLAHVGAYSAYATPAV
jgi:hypothetical protein